MIKKPLSLQFFTDDIKKGTLSDEVSFLRNEELKVLNDSGKENSSLKRITCSILILSLMAKGKLQCDMVML